jgi:hypothetical protein
VTNHLIYYFSQGLYAAPVAKSTIKPGVKNKIFAIKAPTLTFLAGSPTAGFVLWQSLTFPPKTVAQELKLAITKKLL